MMQGDFAERLRRFRNGKEISMERLANETGIALQVLNLIEQVKKKQQFSYPILQKIAKVLEVEIEELIGVKI